MTDQDRIIHLSQFENSSAQHLPMLVDEVRKICQQQFHYFLHKMFDTADDKLFDMSDSGFDKARFDALRLLRLKKETLLKDFCLGLDEQFLLKLSKDAASPKDDNSLTSLSFENIALVENSDLEEEIALDVIVAKTRAENVDALEKIRLRFDTLVSTHSITKAQNPLEPVVICEIFKSAVSSLDLDIETLLVVYKLFERNVCARHSELLDRVNEFFVDRGVLPELRITTPQGYRNPQKGDSDYANIEQSIHDTDLLEIESNRASIYPDQVEQGLGGEKLDEDPVVSVLRQLIAQRKPANGAQSNSNVTAMPAPSTQKLNLDTQQLLAALSGLQRQADLQQGELTQAEALRTTIASQVAPEKNAELSVTPYNEDMIDIVSMLFDFILDDKNLATEIKSVLAKLQIPMLKVGMLDRHFFASKKHPARQLLNELAYAGLSWDSSDVSSKSMLAAITQIVDKICNDFSDDVTIFDKMLAQFTAFKQSHEKKAAILEKRTKEAEEGKAKAETARGKVNQILNEVCSGKRVPEVIKKTFKQVWAHVMFLEALKDEGKGWEKSCQFAKWLVWSVQEKNEEKDLEKLTSMIPKLIKMLKQGFDKISYSFIDASTLLEQLEKEHRKVIENSKQKIFAEEEILRLKPEAFDNANLSDASDSDESHSKEENEGSADEIVIEDVGFSRQQIGQPQETEEVDQPVLAESLVAIEKLHAGSWYELKIDENFKRCKLAARIVSTGRYIFVNRSGMKVAEFLSEQLAAEYQKGNLKLLDDEALFDRALESVISNLRDMKAAAQ